MDNNEVLETIRAAAEELKICKGQIDYLNQQQLIANEQMKVYEEQINRLAASFANLDAIRDIYHSRYPRRSKRFKGRGVVFSAITGGYDSITEPAGKSVDVDYVLFVDRDVPDYSGMWDIRVLENEMKLSNQRLARWVKMHPFELFPEYDWSLWIDGKFRLKDDINGYIETYAGESGMLCFPHYTSRNIRQEAKGIASYGKADENELKKQIDAYEQAGYESRGFIVETGVLLRDHHDEALREVMDAWWNELCSYNHSRDQMSFDYICWKYGYEYDINDLLIYLNSWIEAVSVHD